MKRGEQFAGRIVAEPGTAIEHFDTKHPLAPFALDPAVDLDLRSAFAVCDGIAQEVSERMLDPDAVDPDDLVGHVEVDRNTALARERFHTSND